MPEVPLHDGKPIQKQTGQRNLVLARGIVGYVAKSGFREGENHIRLEFTDGFVQLAASEPRPKQIFEIQSPFSKGRAEARLFDFLERKGQFNFSVDEESIREVGIAGDMEIEGRPLDQVPVHHNTNSAVVVRRHDAHKHHFQFFIHNFNE
jgi:hypothetical protein